MTSLITPPHSWVYAKEFMQSVKLDLPEDMLGDMDDMIQCDWSDATAEFRQKYALRAVIPNSTAPVSETRTLHYYDGGCLSAFSLSSQQFLD